MRTPECPESVGEHLPQSEAAGLALVRDFGLILFVDTIGAHIAREAGAFQREQRAAQQEMRSFSERMRSGLFASPRSSSHGRHGAAHEKQTSKQKDTE